MLVAVFPPRPVSCALIVSNHCNWRLQHARQLLPLRTWCTRRVSYSPLIGASHLDPPSAGPREARTRANGHPHRRRSSRSVGGATLKAAYPATCAAQQAAPVHEPEPAAPHDDVA
ncbi:Protein of unknown function [Gryllus bimaculatus]|nr:Protein of unknown function [Gryllus bimaculatus]